MGVGVLTSSRITDPAPQPPILSEFPEPVPRKTVGIRTDEILAEAYTFALVGLAHIKTQSLLSGYDVQGG